MSSTSDVVEQDGAMYKNDAALIGQWMTMNNSPRVLGRCYDAALNVQSRPVHIHATPSAVVVKRAEALGEIWTRAAGHTAPTASLHTPSPGGKLFGKKT